MVEYSLTVVQNFNILKEPAFIPLSPSLYLNQFGYKFIVVSSPDFDSPSLLKKKINCMIIACNLTEMHEIQNKEINRKIKEKKYVLVSHSHFE
jgi:hypothetical protein